MVYILVAVCKVTMISVMMTKISKMMMMIPMMTTFRVVEDDDDSDMMMTMTMKVMTLTTMMITTVTFHLIKGCLAQFHRRKISLQIYTKTAMNKEQQKITLQNFTWLQNS